MLQAVECRVITTYLINMCFVICNFCCTGTDYLQSYTISMHGNHYPAQNLIVGR